ncbi:hypothetical protein CXB51_033832 [Gossypium anomalum]|uniref:Uncharacterized protein n=1 Tax=Gossypium anomalum TaxID=47600 RepID=A0A8J5YNL0_9ROSI|nr:hypothetical protein CXB51_033832 [Gossypium anomalum]
MNKAKLVATIIVTENIINGLFSNH